MTRPWNRYLSALTLLTLCAVGAFAQSGVNTGLRGVVTDPSGAAVAEAAITVTREDTGETRQVVSAVDGSWEVRFLSAGAYLVAIEAKDFQTSTQEGINVSTDAVGFVPVELTVGPQTETIVVTADADMVVRNSAAIVRELDERDLENLPTSSRNFTQLLLIEPGVSADISNLLSNNNANVSPSVNGGRVTSNSFTFNGVDATNMLCCNSRINIDRGTIAGGGGTLSRNTAPATETLQEVKLNTSLYDASTGRNGGGAFQLVYGSTFRTATRGTFGLGPSSPRATAVSESPSRIPTPRWSSSAPWASRKRTGIMFCSLGAISTPPRKTLKPCCISTARSEARSAAAISRWPGTPAAQGSTLRSTTSVCSTS